MTRNYFKGYWLWHKDYLWDEDDNYHGDISDDSSVMLFYQDGTGQGSTIICTSEVLALHVKKYQSHFWANHDQEDESESIYDIELL